MSRLVTHGIEVYFTRHAESFGNVGESSIDSPLTANGRAQATLLNGNFDIVMCSPLRRAQETLHYSKITHGKVIIHPQLRERCFGENSCLLLEQFMTEETPERFTVRTQLFEHDLRLVCEKLSLKKTDGKVLIVGHAYFLNAWFYGDCRQAPNHAEIIKLA